MRDVGRGERHEVSEIPENRGKNRYVNILACKFVTSRFLVVLVRTSDMP